MMKKLIFKRHTVGLELKDTLLLKNIKGSEGELGDAV